jgi:hypothetical protein
MTTATAELAGLEARLMLRHPAPWLGAALSALMVWDTWDEQWSGERYTGMISAATPLLLGISLASVWAFGRELVPVAEEAPVAAPQRSLARLVGGLPLVVVAAVVVAGTAVWLRLLGGLSLGEEPGRTVHAHHTLPELLQVVLLAAFAVAAGAATVHLVRHRLAASIVLVLVWFVAGATYWLFSGRILSSFALVQVQPAYVDIGPPETDPSTFPSTWLLSGPGEYQDHWARLVVSPGLAAAHDAYLLGLIALAVAVAVPGPTRRLAVIAGATLALLGVALQQAVAP